MINSNIIYSEIYLKNAQDLFIPFWTKVCSSKLTRLQSLIELLREIIFFIPKTIQRKSFIEDFNKKINLTAAVEENFQTNSLDNQNFAVDSCAKRLKQLNSLYKIQLLIKNYYGHTSKNKIESRMNDLIIKNHLLINRYINKTENKKTDSQHTKQIECSPKSHTIDMEDKDNDKTNDLIAKPIQSHQERVESEESEVILKNSSEREGFEGPITSKTQLIESLPFDHIKLAENESPILVDEQAKIVKTGSSIELSQRSEDAQALPHSLIEANNSHIQIGINESNENTSKPNNSEGLWGRVKKWTGVKGLETGVENVRSGNYVKGFCEIASGSIRIALTAYVALFVAQQIIGGFGHDLEIPRVERSQIQSESFNSAIGSRKVTLITAYDEGIKDYAQYVIPNQRTFSAKNGYDYIEYYGNLAHDQGHQRAPYWSKIVAINDQLQKGKEGDWIAWGDASALFTNTKKNFDQIIEKHGSDKDIILTTDPQVPINNSPYAKRLKII